MNIKGQCHSLTFVQGHSDSTFSNFFCSENARPIEANFHMEPPCYVRNENLFKCSRSHDHAHIWWKTSKIFFFGTNRLMTLKLGIQHQVLECYQCFHMMTMGWPWPFLWQGQICFRMLLHGRKLIQHWVLLYFQVCSNSAYPQHSGERYRTRLNTKILIIYYSSWQNFYCISISISFSSFVLGRGGRVSGVFYTGRLLEAVRYGKTTCACSFSWTSA